eukprot:118367-Prymnesium_polylepis.1
MVHGPTNPVLLMPEYNCSLRAWTCHPSRLHLEEQIFIQDSLRITRLRINNILQCTWPSRTLCTACLRKLGLQGNRSNGSSCEKPRVESQRTYPARNSRCVIKPRAGHRT